jgi:hypothetical protein
MGLRCMLMGGGVVALRMVLGCGMMGLRCMFVMLCCLLVSFVCHGITFVEHRFNYTATLRRSRVNQCLFVLSFEQIARSACGTLSVSVDQSRLIGP